MSRRGLKAPSAFRPPPLRLGLLLFSTSCLHESAAGLAPACALSRICIDTLLCRFRFGNEHAIRIAIFADRIDADVALLVQRIFDHLRGEYHAVPRHPELVR